MSLPKTGALELPDFELELGGALRGARIAYRTHGTLSAARDNAVLFPHMYAGAPASLDRWIEPGRPLDPGRWFVVCPGQLGAGESSSPSNGEGSFRRSRSATTSRRSAASSTTSGSSESSSRSASRWARSRPGSGGCASRRRVRRLALLRGHRADDAARRARGLSGRRGACGRGGLDAHARYWAATALSPELFRHEAWRDAGFASVDDLVQRLFVDDFAGLDAENLLCQLGKWARADVRGTRRVTSARP